MASLRRLFKNTKNDRTRFIVGLLIIWALLFNLSRRGIIKGKFVLYFLLVTIFSIGPLMLYIAWSPGTLEGFGSKSVTFWRVFLSIVGVFITIYTLLNFGNLTYF